ncbi:MAG: hypothetical protein QOD93_1030 [Acetobacteraceae bacterium]|nr:hypothetical protein [Acetobacteraceae bacterium]
MMKQLLKVVLCGAVLSGTALAGPSISSAYAQAASIQAYSAEQLDALLAPIALYPDALLAQVLMASTFPLQVVSAGRWVDDPANKSLSGDALAKALEPQTWDPSVKSLVPFSSVLALVIVYGEWPYRAYPPVYLPPPPGYIFGTAPAGGIAFATGLAVVGSLWGWARPGWRTGYVNVNVNNYNSINVNRAQINSNVWQPNRPGGRPAGLPHPPNGPVGQPGQPRTLPANTSGGPNGNVPGGAANRPQSRPGAGATTPPNRPNGRQAYGPDRGQSSADRPGGRPPAAPGSGAGSSPQWPTPLPGRPQRLGNNLPRRQHNSGQGRRAAGLKAERMPVRRREGRLGLAPANEDRPSIQQWSPNC